jgi:hypothetical protein
MARLGEYTSQYDCHHCRTMRIWYTKMIYTHRDTVIETAWYGTIDDSGVKLRIDELINATIANK